MSVRITHIDPEAMIRKLKEKVSRLEKAQRKPLTDEQIKSVIQSIDPSEEYLPRALQQFARAIAAAIRARGTHEA